jgi:hypothetical protein
MVDSAHDGELTTQDIDTYLAETEDLVKKKET